MSDLPMISVVTPSFNQGRFLEATIRSVLEQDYPHLEYLILDGGSTDGSVEIIRKYRDRLAWWVSCADGGQGDAINKGFARARGDILVWLNSDDCFVPGALRKVGQAFLEHPQAHIVHGNGWSIDESGRRNGPLRSGPFSVVTFLRDKGPFMIQPASFFRRDTIETLGPLNVSNRYMLEYDLYLRAALRFNFLYIDDILAEVRDYLGTKRSETGIGLPAEGKRTMDIFFQRPDLPQTVRDLAPEAFRSCVEGFLAGNRIRGTPEMVHDFFNQCWEKGLIGRMDIEDLAHFFGRENPGPAADRDAPANTLLNLHRALYRKYAMPNAEDPESWARRRTTDFLLRVANDMSGENRRQAANRFFGLALRVRRRALLTPAGLRVLARLMLGRHLVSRLGILRRWWSQ